MTERQTKEDPLRTKSMAFAVRVYRLSKWLREERKEFSLADQILRSGTSIGANLAEARCAVSKKDFLNKCKIAQKECSETQFWLELLGNCDLLGKAEQISFLTDCLELRRLLSATCQTLEKGLSTPSKPISTLKLPTPVEVSV